MWGRKGGQGIFFKDVRLSNPQTPPENLNLMNIFGNVAGYKINIYNATAFPRTSNQHAKKETRRKKQVLSPITSKKKLPRSKFNQSCKESQ